MKSVFNCQAWCIVLNIALNTTFCHCWTTIIHLVLWLSEWKTSLNLSGSMTWFTVTVFPGSSFILPFYVLRISLHDVSWPYFSLLECHAVLLGELVLNDRHSFVFRAKESKKTQPLVPSKWRPHNLVRYQKPIAQWHSIISQKTCVLHNTPVITSNLTVLSLFVMPDASHLNSGRMPRGFLLKATRAMQQIMTLSSPMTKIWLEGTSAKGRFIRFVSSDLCNCPPGSEKD